MENQLSFAILITEVSDGEETHGPQHREHGPRQQVRHPRHAKVLTITIHARTAAADLRMALAIQSVELDDPSELRQDAWLRAERAPLACRPGTRLAHAPAASCPSALAL